MLHGNAVGDNHFIMALLVPGLIDSRQCCYGTSVPHLGHWAAQDSVFSLILLNILIKLLEEVLRRFDYPCHQYMDNTELYLSVSSNCREMVETLEGKMGWMSINTWKLNLDMPRDAVVIPHSSLRDDVSPMLDSTVLSLQTNVLSLFTLTPCLAFGCLGSD